MITSEDIRKRRDEILAVAKRYGAFDVRIFGSVARGDPTESSDLDLVVRFEPGRSLFDQGGLLMDLRELWGSKSTSFQKARSPEDLDRSFVTRRSRYEGMRHIMVHDYFKVDWDIVYNAARFHAPALKPQIEAILSSLPPDRSSP